MADKNENKAIKPMSVRTGSRKHPTSNEPWLLSREHYAATRSLEARHQRAADRQAKRAKRSPREQLDELDYLLGRNTGAVKERARLKKLIEAEQPAAGA